MAVLEEFNRRREVFAFPDIESLAKATERSLRALGLGYRAAYVLKAGQMLKDGTMLKWLEESKRRQIKSGVLFDYISEHIYMHIIEKYI